jgi:hypothetical protein
MQIAGSHCGLRHTGKDANDKRVRHRCAILT